MRDINIGSRGSDLALWQAHYIQKQLQALGVSANISVIKTQGDIIQNLSFDKMEGKGFFTKEIENALLDTSIDLAVHSHKDLETNTPLGLTIAAVSQRENPSDMLLINKDAVDISQKWLLKKNARIGTSSVRRKSQIVAHRPDLIINDLRGNVPTRIEKLNSNNFDAIVIACAGVKRLDINLTKFEVLELAPEEFVPAPAQGVLGLQIRSDDIELLKILREINDAQTQKIVEIEREILNLMNGGCQIPLGVYCKDEHNISISYNKNWEMGAKYFNYQSDNIKLIIPQIVADLQQQFS